MNKISNFLLKSMNNFSEIRDVQKVKQLFYFIYKMKTKKGFKMKILGKQLLVYSYILGNFNSSISPAYSANLSLTRRRSIRFFPDFSITLLDIFY
jgi:hypothetical protein